jgi:hypothetical protein
METWSKFQFFLTRWSQQQYMPLKQDMNLTMSYFGLTNELAIYQCMIEKHFVHFQANLTSGL